MPYALHTIGDNNRGQTMASIESILPYTLHTIGDSHRGQTFAMEETTITYARHCIRDNNRGHTFAICESIIPYARHTIGCTLMLKGLWDNNFSRIILATALRYNYSLFCLSNKFIIYPINLNLYRQHGQGQKHCQGQTQYS